MNSYEPSKVRSCLVCAWRENCQKKFGGGPEIAQNCVDFSPDVRLMKQENEKTKPTQEER